MAKLSAVLATLGCFAAGGYLLSSHSIGAPSWFDLLAHGIGLYFIAKGLFVGASMSQQFRAADALEKLVDWRKYEYDVQQSVGADESEGAE
jgi:hypothetical protein